MIYTPIKRISDCKKIIKTNKTPENKYWDYKAVYDKKDPVGLAIDMAAFANNLGGTIIFGISEKLNGQKLKVAHQYCGIQNSEEIKKAIYNSVKNKIFPYINFSLDVDTEGALTLMFLNVEPNENSLVTVRINDGRNGFCMPKRTDYGNEYMNYSEIEAHMADQSTRTNHIKLIRHLKGASECEIKLYPKPIIRSKNVFSRVKIIRENYSEFELIINNMVIRLPYNIIDNIWNRANVGTDICIKLKDRLIQTSTDGLLEIDHPLDFEDNFNKFKKLFAAEDFANANKNMELMLRRLGI